MTTKFKSRYVLGEGYPWATGIGTVDSPYDTIVLHRDSMMGQRMQINFPTELWSKDLPKYRLVLERVDE